MVRNSVSLPENGGTIDLDIDFASFLAKGRNSGKLVLIKRERKNHVVEI
jgi:hypothetical protein